MDYRSLVKTKYDIAALKESNAGWEATIRQIESGFGPDGKPVTEAVKRHGIEIARSIIHRNKRKIAELEGTI